MSHTKPYFRYHFSGFPKVRTGTSVRLRQEILYETQANVVAHLVELPVYFKVVTVEVFAKLCHHCTVRERDKLRIHFVDPRPFGLT